MKKINLGLLVTKESNPVNYEKAMEKFAKQQVDNLSTVNMGSTDISKTYKDNLFED